ncbi:MAG: DUF624 domain-containing protein [Lachnospiraceae bacterium]|nr:DUF624 domain-containing protein [Lachnospiraceae bacterium]
MLRSFFFDPDSGLLLFFGRIVDFLWLSIMMVLGCIPIITAGASISAGLYCCRKMYLHEESHLTRMFWDSYKANMKKGIPLLFIMLDIFLILGGLIMIIFLDEKILGRPLNVPIIVIGIILFLFFVCLLALMHVFPLNAYFENTVASTLKNSFLVAITNLPVTLGLLTVNALPFLFCYNYPVLWFFEIFFGVGFCAFCSAQLYRKILVKLGVEEITADESVSTEAADKNAGKEADS